MRMSEVLQHIAHETQVLEAHFAEGLVDRNHVEQRADMIASYALLLRDMAGARAHKGIDLWLTIEKQLAEVER